MKSHRVKHTIQQRLTTAPVRRSREQRRLEADLSTFTSQADLQDLAAALDRHDDAESAGIRDAVDWTRAA